MKRYKSTKIASILGIIGNVFLLIIKGLIGYITNSQAMIADAFNSAGDIFSSIMTFVGNKISSIPRDDDHNLGHGKAEYIYSMLISISMILISLVVFKNSLSTLKLPHPHLHFNSFSVKFSIVAFITIYNSFLIPSISRELITFSSSFYHHKPY